MGIKFTRATELKQRALKREIQIMSLLMSQGAKVDPEGSQYLVCLIFLEGSQQKECFEHKGHLAVVFEAMKYNLLTALERHGKGRGLPLLPTVRGFGKQLFLALRVLRRAGFIHSDIKPENLLVSKDGGSIKLSDFGNMLTINEAEGVVDEFQMPIFYRAPEVILGQRFDPAIDMWGGAATLFQMATDQFLFIPQTNNEMLHEMLKIFGPFPSAMTTTGSYAQAHFDSAGNFILRQTQNIASKTASEHHPIVKTVPMESFSSPPRPISESLKILLFNTPTNVPQERHEHLVNHFGDLLSCCSMIDPKCRASPEDALKHRFFAKGAGDPMADLAALWNKEGQK